MEGKSGLLCVFSRNVWGNVLGSDLLRWLWNVPAPLTTCAKPEAVASFYVFDAKKERCYKPVVGFAPVDDNQVKTLTPKQMETGEWL